MRMNSSHETKLHLLFRMKGEIYQEADLNICLKNLKLQETDLVITSNSQMKKIKETNALGKAVLLNMDAYGTKEPKEEWVDDILKVANAYPYERIIAIGGGTVMFQSFVYSVMADPYRNCTAIKEKYAKRGS